MELRATKEIPCASWDDFKARVHADYAEEMRGISPLFRGHASTTWKLASPWDRKLEKWAQRERARSRKNSDHLLDKILRDFKELSVGLPGLKSRELEDLDWWALGRHFGLITPLLDWTKSPYVASFFAFAGFAEFVSPGITISGDIEPGNFLQLGTSEPVAVWALMVDENFGQAKELEILNPRIDIGQRQRAQRGLFTRLTHDEYFDIESYLSSLELEEAPLRKYLIPGWEVAKALTELRMMNITFATLFPDLEGAALQANFESVAFTLMAFSMVSRDTWTSTSGLRDAGTAHNTTAGADS